MDQKHIPTTTDSQESLVQTSLQVTPRDQHNVSRQQISSGCLKILYRLNEAGYQAFIVGGGVRDLLLGLHPKDFDIATNATPEQVKELFRNSRIIGRRFRIVHVRFGRELIEVSTFRAAPQDSVQIAGESLGRKIKNIDSARSASGMLLRDNVYGDIEGDVQRRDFTANALYYTVKNFEIHDYVQGMKDVENRVLRMIGNPSERYREDPVRTLRAIRLSVKLGFSIEKETAEPIKEFAKMLESIPAARLFDECLKLFFSGFARPTFEALREYSVFQYLFPQTEKMIIKEPSALTFINLAMNNTDQRLAEGKSVAPYFLLATILWPAVEKQFKHHLSQGMPELVAMYEASDEVLGQQVQRIAIPKRLSIPMREIWELQLRLPNRRGKRAEALLRHRRFRAAYDFLLLREANGLQTKGLGSWWTEFQVADHNERLNLQALLGPNQKHSKKRRRRVKSSPKRVDKPSE